MRRGLAAAAVGAVIALSGAPFAHAAPPNPPVVTEGHVSVSMSNGNTNPPLLAGHFHVDDPNATVSIKAAVTWTGPDPEHHPKFAPQNVCPGAQCTTDSNGNVDFAGVPLQPAVFNGPYHIDATAAATDVFGSGEQTAKTDFAVAVAPPPVTAVTATADKSRNVTVSWDRDAGTPDVQWYYVWRKGPGDKDFTAAYQVPQLNTGARVTIVDQGKYLGKGGDYVYQIETRRNGATGDGSSYIGSDRSKSQSNKVTVPDPPPGQTIPPTTAPKGGGAPPVVRGTPSGVNRNSGFSGGSSATTPTSEAVTPDPGFVHGLPDAGEGPSPEDQNGNEGDNSAVAVTPGRHSSSGRGYLVPVAGAAVLVLGALHLRILKKRLDEPPGTGLTPV